MILTKIWANPFDYAISSAFSGLFNSMPEFLQKFFIEFSALNDMGLFLGFIGLLFLIPKQTRKIGIFCLLSIAFTMLINDLILKSIFQRARPWTDPELVKLCPSLTVLPDGTGVPPGYLPGEKSFPSGHTFQSFAIMGAMVFAYIFDKEDRKFNLWFMIFFIVFGTLMGLTRVLLTHHYFTDVLAGASIGFVTGIGIYYLVKYTPILFNKIKNKNKKEEISE